MPTTVRPSFGRTVGPDGTVYVVDSANGQELWDYDVKDAIWSAPSIRPDGTLVLAHRGGLVMVLGDQS